MINKKFTQNSSKKQSFHTSRYRRSPRHKIQDSTLLIPSCSSFHLSKTNTNRKQLDQDYDKKMQTPKGTHYYIPTAESSMIQLQDPNFINEEIDDFMERLKDQSPASNASRIKTVYFQDTISQINRDKLDDKKQEDHKYENKGFCRISYELSKKLANTNSYKRYKQQKKICNRKIDQNEDQQIEQKDGNRKTREQKGQQVQIKKQEIKQCI